MSHAYKSFYRYDSSIHLLSLPYGPHYTTHLTGKELITWLSSHTVFGAVSWCFMPLTTWAATWQNQQNERAPSEDSDQPRHPPSLIRVFAVRMKKLGSLSIHWTPAKTLIRLVQADLSLRWAHTNFVGFVMSWLVECRWRDLEFNYIGFWSLLFTLTLIPTKQCCATYPNFNYFYKPI